MKSKIFAVSIGIGRYAELPPLSCPRRDAYDIASVIHGGAIASEIKLLTDSDATKETILKELAWIADCAGSTDTSILFFSGHGGRLSGTDARSFLCPVDVEPKNIERTCLSSDELSGALNKIKSSRVIVFLDTCHSGGTGDLRYYAGMQTGVTQSSIGAMVEGNGWMILAASHPDSPALETRTMRNGIFTSYLLKALGGEVAQTDGRVWASDVFRFVAQRLRRHHAQDIYHKAAGGDFVIMTHKRPSAAGFPAILDSTSDQRTVRIGMLSVYDRADLERLCHDLNLHIDHFPGRTLESQMLYLIDFCHRHGLRNRLMEFVYADHPELFADCPTMATSGATLTINPPAISA